MSTIIESYAAFLVTFLLSLFKGGWAAVVQVAAEAVVSVAAGSVGVIFGLSTSENYLIKCAT